MRPKTTFSRTVVTLLLLLCSAAFVAPFVWLVSTPVLRMKAKKPSFNNRGVSVDVNLSVPMSLVYAVVKAKPGGQPSSQLLKGTDCGSRE